MREFTTQPSKTDEPELEWCAEIWILNINAVVSARFMSGYYFTALRYCNSQLGNNARLIDLKRSNADVPTEISSGRRLQHRHIRDSPL